jgi:ribosomal protein S18 acetylase RimI-like enzyme
MKNVSFRSTINQDDIVQVMKVVETFGAIAENLVKIKNYITKELLELGDNRILYLLEGETRVIGMVQLILKKADGDPELANGKDTAHIHSLQVAKDLHRQGYARHLMQELEKEASRIGLTKLTLGVDRDNEKARNLYSSLGYTLLKEVEGRTPEVNLFYLQKNLG